MNRENFLHVLCVAIGFWPIKLVYGGIECMSVCLSVCSDVCQYICTCIGMFVCYYFYYVYIYFACPSAETLSTAFYSDRFLAQAITVLLDSDRWKSYPLQGQLPREHTGLQPTHVVQ